MLLTEPEREKRERRATVGRVLIQSAGAVLITGGWGGGDGPKKMFSFGAIVQNISGYLETSALIE